VEQVSTPTEFSDYKEFVVYTEDIVEPDNVIMPTEFTKHVDLFLKFRDVLRIVP
jgi:hypothetical protein